MAKASITKDFLSEIIENKTPVTVFLVNGVKLQGLITLSDAETLLLKRDGHTQLIYKHAVSTVMPNSATGIEEKAE